MAQNYVLRSSLVRRDVDGFCTMLAPTTTFVENVLRNLMPLSDQRELKAMRISLVVFAIGVLTYALLMEGTPIYELAAMLISSRLSAPSGL